MTADDGDLPRIRLFFRSFFGGFLFGFAGGFFGRGFGEGVVVFGPGIEEAVENSADDFGGVLEIAAAGAGHHHPCRHEGLADVAVGDVGGEVLEERFGAGFFDGGPDLHVAVEDELELLARGGEGAAFGGVVAPDGVAGVGE